MEACRLYSQNQSSIFSFVVGGLSKVLSGAKNPVPSLFQNKTGPSRTGVSPGGSIYPEKGRAFSFLKGSSYPEELVQRKHHYAMVDEVDSVLIDDARTPLIISGPGKIKFGDKAVALHAQKLTFFHPISDEKMEFESQPGMRFRCFLIGWLMANYSLRSIIHEIVSCLKSVKLDKEHLDRSKSIVDEAWYEKAEKRFDMARG